MCFFILVILIKIIINPFLLSSPDTEVWMGTDAEEDYDDSRSEEEAAIHHRGGSAVFAGIESIGENGTMIRHL